MDVAIPGGGITGIEVQVVVRVFSECGRETAFIKTEKRLEINSSLQRMSNQQTQQCGCRQQGQLSWQLSG